MAVGDDGWRRQTRPRSDPPALIHASKDVEEGGRSLALTRQKNDDWDACGRWDVVYVVRMEHMPRVSCSYGGGRRRMAAANVPLVGLLLALAAAANPRPNLDLAVRERVGGSVTR